MYRKFHIIQPVISRSPGCVIAVVFFFMLMIFPSGNIFGQWKGAITEYQPNYIVVNKGDGVYGQVKFRFSFQYGIGKREGWDSASKFFLSYTQVAFWDAYRESLPMREVNFNPAIRYMHVFKRKNLLWQNKSLDLRLGNLQFGYQHQSNGRNDSLNRSYFKYFIEGSVRLQNKKNGSGFRLSAVELVPQVWRWRRLALNNANISDYLGYGQLATTCYFDYGHTSAGPPPLELGHILIPGKKAVSHVINLAFFPFSKSPRVSWPPGIILQYWDGFGESMVNYDNRLNGYRRQTLFRAGIRFRVK